MKDSLALHIAIRHKPSRRQEYGPRARKGKRHFRPACRWEVLSSPAEGLRGTHLPAAEAKRMFSFGDFYPDGTVIHIQPDDVTVYVVFAGRIGRLYLDPDATQQYEDYTCCLPTLQ